MSVYRKSLAHKVLATKAWYSRSVQLMGVTGVDFIQSVHLKTRLSLGLDLGSLRWRGLPATQEDPGVLRIPIAQTGLLMDNSFALPPGMVVGSGQNTLIPTYVCTYR